VKLATDSLAIFCSRFVGRSNTASISWVIFHEITKRNKRNKILRVFTLTTGTEPNTRRSLPLQKNAPCSLRIHMWLNEGARRCNNCRIKPGYSGSELLFFSFRCFLAFLSVDGPACVAGLFAPLTVFPFPIVLEVSASLWGIMAPDVPDA
jgi:hypothetical protein